MHEEVLGHLEFWTQFRQYLDDHKSQIRLSKPSNTSSSNVVLRRSYFHLRPWHLLKGNRLGVSVQFNEPGGTARYELITQQHRRQVNERVSSLGALDWQPGKILLSRSPTTSKPETWQERNAWMANAIETMRALFNELFPPAAPLNLEFNDDKVVNSDTGEEYVADDKSLDMKGQTAQVLKKIDAVLEKAGTDKSRILSATVYMADAGLKDEMNEAWMAWVDRSNLPTRTAVGAVLTPGTMVEITICAAK